MTELSENKPGIETRVLEGFLSDIRAQPNWRVEADRAADYYDGNQLAPDVIAKMEKRGQPVLIHNLIGPAIDGVLGLEAKSRANYKLVADDDSGLPVVDAMNQELNECSRLSLSNKACSDAYAAQIKCGLGWVEVSRSTDPFQYLYSCTYIHRNEIWWDWHSKRADLEDCRWLLRRKWVDSDALIHYFPQWKDLVEHVSNGWAGWDQWGELNSISGSSPLSGAYNTAISTTIQLNEWWNSERKRALTYEVYYRVWDKRPVVRTATGEVFVYDKTNPVHVAAVATGKVQVSVESFSKMRLAFFIGPHKVADMESPQPHNKFPYVPFFGYREDRSGIPYGLIRRMMPAQDEINHRRSKLTWLLNIKRVIKDHDALHAMSDEKMLDEIYRADGVINLNPNRKNKDAFRIDTDTGIASQQFQVLQESQKLIQDVAGIYSAFLGQESGAKSGVAINSLVEQGTTTLSELNDNYQFARQLVGELLLAHIVSDIGQNEKQVRINVNSPKKTKTIILNERVEDETGRVQINNAVLKVKMRVVLEDVASTAGYRQQLHLALMEMVNQAPPEYKAALYELVVETSDLSNRDEVLQQIRKISGSVDKDQLSEEELQAMEQQKELQNKQQELQFKEMEAAVSNAVAEAQIKMAEAEKIKNDMTIDLQTKAAQLEKLRAETKQIVTNIVKIRHDMLNVVDSKILELQAPELQQAS